MYEFFEATPSLPSDDLHVPNQYVVIFFYEAFPSSTFFLRDRIE